MARTTARASAALLSASALAIGIAACGGGGDDGGSGVDGKNPLDTALHYVPKDTPFVAAFPTNPSGSQVKNVQGIIKKFPFSGQVTRGFEEALRGRDVNFDRDIRPLLGNQFVAAATDVRSFTNDNADTNFVGAIEVKDQDKLQAALDKEKPKDVGEAEGVKLKQDDDTFYAVDDDVLVVSDKKGTLEASLKDARGDAHFSESDFDEGTDGLPKDAAARAYFNVKELIDADPETAQARKVKWVRALRGFGITAAAKPDSIDIDFNLSTDSSGLSDADLPMASGAESPEVIDREGQVGFGLRGIDQIVKFAESTGQTVSPSDYSQYQQAKTTIAKQLDVDIDDDIVSQLSGDLTTSTSTDGRSAAKIELDDPSGFEKTLAKVNKAVPGFADGARPRRAGGGLFSIADDGQTVYYGVVDDSFVVAQTPADAREVASAPTSKVDGAKGALVFNTDAEQLVQAAIRQASGVSSLGGRTNPLQGLTGALGTSLFTGPLGQLKGWAEAETDGITGKVSLTFD